MFSHGLVSLWGFRFRSLREGKQKAEEEEAARLRKAREEEAARQAQEAAEAARREKEAAEAEHEVKEAALRESEATTQVLSVVTGTAYTAPQAEAGPQAEAKPEEKDAEPAQEHPDAVETDQAPGSSTTPAGKQPPSRSLEKREMRRKRGLEHSQRESVRAASSAKEQSAKELEPSTIVPGKEEQHEDKNNTKRTPAGPVRPATLHLDVPSSNEPTHSCAKESASRGSRATDQRLSGNNEEKTRKILQYDTHTHAHTHVYTHTYTLTHIYM